MVKNPSAMQETWVRSLGQEDPLEESMATHSIILAWRTPTDKGAWQPIVHGVAKSQTQLNDKAHTQGFMCIISLQTETILLLPFPVWRPLFVFLLIALARTFSFIQKASAWSENSCLDLRGKAFSFSLLSMMLVMSLSDMAFIAFR